MNRACPPMQELVELRKQLMDEAGTFNRARAMTDARTTALEHELEDLHKKAASAADCHERDRREWLAEKDRMRAEYVEMQTRADKAEAVVLDLDRRVHEHQHRIRDTNAELSCAIARQRAAEESQKKAEVQFLLMIMLNIDLHKCRWN